MATIDSLVEATLIGDDDLFLVDQGGEGKKIKRENISVPHDKTLNRNAAGAHDAEAISYALQTVAEKMLEIASTEDYPSVQSAIDSAVTVNVNGEYLSDVVTIANKIHIYGYGSITTDQVDTSIINCFESGNPSTKIENISIHGVTLKDQPVSTFDNFAALSLYNTTQALISGVKTDNTETGIRLGYAPSGAVTEYPIVALNHIRNARTFGIENIESQYPVHVGNIIHNNGAKVGSHGIRYTSGLGSGTDGAVTVGNIVSDRSGKGVSTQSGMEHIVFVGNLIKNTGGDGFTTDLTSTEAQQNMIQAAIVDSGADGVDLTWLSHCFVDVVTKNCAGSGVRVGNAADQGLHLVRVVSLNDNVSARIASDYNHVTVIADGTTAPSGLLVSGSKNIVDIISKNTADISVYVTGNDNILRVIQGDGVTTGLRVDGHRNTIVANIGGTVTINGNNNTISGVLSGNVFNNGTGNDFSDVKGFYGRGKLTATTDASGNITVTHGLSASAWSGASVIVGVFGNNDYSARVSNVTSSQIVINIKNSSGVNVTATDVTVSWQAEY